MGRHFPVVPACFAWMKAWGKTPGPNEATWTWNLEQGPVGSSQVQKGPALSTDENSSDGSLAGPKAEFPVQDVGRFPKGQYLGSAWEIFSGNAAACPGGREAVRHMQLQTGEATATLWSRKGVHRVLTKPLGGFPAPPACPEGSGDPTGGSGFPKHAAVQGPGSHHSADLGASQHPPRRWDLPGKPSIP